MIVMLSCEIARIELKFAILFAQRVCGDLVCNLWTALNGDRCSAMMA